jgi:hypothetical protein
MASFASQNIQLVKETSYGVTPGSPTYKRFNAMRIAIQQQYEANPFAGTGLVVPSLVTIDDKFVQGDVEGRAAYNDLGYVLCSLFGAPTTTTPGGATLARQHVWTWNGSTEPAWVSYTAQYGDATLADTVTGLVFRSMEYGGGRMDGLDFSASILAKPLTTGATLDGTATDVPAVPINAPEMDVYMDTTWAGVGTTKLLKTYNANIAIADRLDRTRPINSTQGSDGLVQLADQEHKLDLQMEVDSVSKGLYAVADSGAFRYIQIRNTGGIIEAAIAYLLKIDATVIFTGTSGYEEYNNIHALTWNGRIARDASANCLRITLINTTLTY